MPEIKIITRYRAIPILVDEREHVSAKAAAELLQSVLTQTEDCENPPPSAAYSLAITAMKLADQVNDLKSGTCDLKQEVERLKTELDRPPEKIEVPVTDPDIETALRFFAEKTESLACRLEEKFAGK